MAKYIIRGGRALKGSVKISGNKNATFPCISAALLTKDKVVLKNIPDIDDVKIILEILGSIGVKTKFIKSTLEIDASTIKSHILPGELMKKLRGSIVLVGALLGRLGKAEFIFPGGDIVGKRSIQTHLDGFTKLGFRVKNSDLDYSITKLEKGTEDVFLNEASVTATENLILSSVLSKGKTTLRNCAQEPHISDLCLMLCKMGASIEGIGSSFLKITGIKKLHGCEFTIGPDYLELATYAIASSLTKGEISLTNCNTDNLEPVIKALEKIGITLKKSANGLKVLSKEILPIKHLTTNIWPGFPTDLMSVFIVLVTQAKGISLMHDWMYETRMFFVDKLISMGANITIADPHRVLVYGPTKLFGREVESPDIRAGMALVLAALIAKGESTINKAELIDRGYEDVVGKLSILGANIKREPLVVN